MNATPTISTLSAWQPWATLLVSGAKRVESRSWRLVLPFPCVVAIHAAKHWMGELFDLTRSEPFRTPLAALGVDWPASARPEARPRPARPRGMAFGAVVGLVRFCACVPFDRIWFAEEDGPPAWDAADKYSSLGLGRTERDFGEYTPGRWGWLTDRALAFDGADGLPEPIPLRGFQSIWQWAAPPDVVDLAEELLS